MHTCTIVGCGAVPRTVKLGCLLQVQQPPLSSLLRDCYVVQIVLLYYSGHGALTKKGLAPCAVGVDGKLVNLQKEFLSAADQAAPSGTNAVILLSDACLEVANSPQSCESTTQGESQEASASDRTAGNVSQENDRKACKGNLLVGAHATLPGQVAIEADRMLYGMWTSCLLEAMLVEDCRGADVLKVLAKAGRLMKDKGCSEPPYALFTPGALRTVSLARYIALSFSVLLLHQLSCQFNVMVCTASASRNLYVDVQAS